MPHRLKTLLQFKDAVIDAVQINLPWGSCLAYVTLAEVKDLVAIISIAIGATCTILVTRHKLKKKDDQ